MNCIIKKWFVLGMIFHVFVFFSCSGLPAEVADVLNETVNRKELETAIDYYKSTGDRQKLKAAYFLIGNMGDKHSLHYGFNENIYELYHAGKGEDDVGLKAEIDSLIKSAAHRKPLVVFDKDVITADYLIRNIELAFAVWKEPWAIHFSFEEFCEHILPYRIQNEPLSDWRQILYDEYYPYKDSVSNISDTRELALYINDAIALRFATDDHVFLDLPLVPITLLNKVRAGICEQRYMYVVSALRAVGIPAMMEYTPQISKKYEDHSWVSCLDASHRLLAFDGGQQRDIPFVGNTGFRRAFPDSAIIPLRYGFGPTVFRYTYSVDRESVVRRVGNPSELPWKFRSPSFRKVTGQYLFDQQDISLTLDSSFSFPHHIAWLAVFSVRKELRVADWAIARGNNVTFASIGKGLTYVVCTYENGRLVPVSNPIVFRDSVLLELNPDTMRKERVVLTRKFKPTLEFNNFSRAMTGAIFQGSDNPWFRHAKELFVIDAPPSYMVEGKVTVTDAFRFVRYFSPEKDIRVAEIEFWQDSLKLNGKTIYHIQSDTLLPDCFPRQAFDESIRTNFNAPAGSWVGLDLGSPRRVTRVAFLPRNNFNVIEPGDTYELFYYNKGWCSLGVKTATDQYLRYDNVPRDALLLLSNLTQGKEERVFTYENGEQIFQ